jgi:hypothetical protein
MALTTIPLDSKLRDRLKTYGTAGMSYNDIIQRLLDEKEMEKFIAELQRTADDPNTEWVEWKDIDWDD